MKTMRRHERCTTEERAYQILKNCEYAFLATINVEDASPYCVPVSPILDEKCIYFHCALEGQKIDNIYSNSKVCLTCVGETQLKPEQFTTAYASAIITGTAQIITHEEEKIEILKKICAKYAPIDQSKINTYIAKLLSKTAVCKINIVSISGKENTP